jgi:hypothetical protein
MKFSRFVSLLPFSQLQGWALSTGEGPAVRNYDVRTEGGEAELHAIIP